MSAVASWGDGYLDKGLMFYHTYYFVHLSSILLTVNNVKVGRYC